MLKIRALIGFSLCLLLISTPAMGVEFGVRGYYWFPTLSGDISYDGSDASGTELDLVNDLGLDDESFPMIEVFVGLGDHHLSFTYYSVTYEGSETLDEDFEFGDTTFNADSDVDTEVEYTVMDFAYQWDVVNFENMLAGASLGLVGKIKYFDIFTTIEEDDIKAEVDLAVPIPMVGLNLHIGILADILEARVQLAGIGYAGNSVIEFFGDVSYTPFPFLDIHAGYRSFTMAIEVEDYEANFGTAGPYAALTLSF